MFVTVVCVTGKSAVDAALLLILQPSNCTEGGSLQHSSLSTMNVEFNSMFVQVVCVSLAKLLWTPPFC